jgi:hypothetical protein
MGKSLLGTIVGVGFVVGWIEGTDEVGTIGVGAIAVGTIGVGTIGVGTIGVWTIGVSTIGVGTIELIDGIEVDGEIDGTETDGVEADEIAFIGSELAIEVVFSWLVAGLSNADIGRVIGRVIRVLHVFMSAKGVKLDSVFGDEFAVLKIGGNVEEKGVDGREDELAEVVAGSSFVGRVDAGCKIEPTATLDAARWPEREGASEGINGGPKPGIPAKIVLVLAPGLVTLLLKPLAIPIIPAGIDVGRGTFVMGLLSSALVVSLNSGEDFIVPNDGGPDGGEGDTMLYHEGEGAEVYGVVVDVEGGGAELLGVVERCVGLLGVVVPLSPAVVGSLVLSVCGGARFIKPERL